VLQAGLRPVQIIADEDQFSRYLLTGELELWLLPAEHRNLADKALEHLKEAVSFFDGNPVRGDLNITNRTMARLTAFYSTYFLKEKEKDKALELIFSIFEKTAGDTAKVLMGTLTYLTGELFGTSKEEWLEWWKKRGNQ
jgi:hypothetical protein